MVDQAALDRYTFIRRAYLQRREYLVYDGKPPPGRTTTNDQIHERLASRVAARRCSRCVRRSPHRAPRCAQEAPDALVKRVSQEVLQIIKTDPKVQAGDQARIREVIEIKLLPNFDFTRMTALAMGRNWAKATPEQQKRLADEFRSLLVRTYSSALDAVPQPDDRLQAAARRRRAPPT